MHKESLPKIVGLAMIGLVMYPWFVALDAIKNIKKKPSYYEIMLAKALKRVK